MSWRSGSAGGPASVSDVLTGLERLDVAELRVRFRNHAGRIAPARIGRQMLLRILAYRIQADAHGDLRPETRRLLARLATDVVQESGDDRAAASAVKPPVALARPQRGTVLVREWRGRLERVEVVDDGYAWSGTAYPSLSAVAKAITGTKWNGRRFFGLDRPGATA